MKKFKLLSAVAVAGLLGLSSVRAAAPVNYDIVTVKLTALVQTNLESSSKVLKIKLTTKDLLNQIAAEFPSNAAAITNSGAKLAVYSFFDGEFAVLNKTNGVVLADASESTNDDDYDLYFETENSVDAYSESDSKEVDNYTAVAFFGYENANDSVYFDLDGSAAVHDKYTDAKDSESFGFFGTGDGEYNGHEAVVAGKATGSGPDNDSID
jgi:hypothetical protein